jgi:hypothetical protein
MIDQDERIEWAFAQDCDHPVDKLVLVYLAAQRPVPNRYSVDVDRLAAVLNLTGVMLVRSLYRMDEGGLIYLERHKAGLVQLSLSIPESAA